MDGKVLLEAVEALVKIKKVDRNMVFDALEMVLLTAYKKESGSNAKASVSLNRETGEYKIYEEKTVVDEIHEDSENAINEITVEEAKKIDRSYEAGDMLRIDVTPKNFGRVAAQAAKQVMIQKLREAERGSIYDEFSGREGDVITGVVKWNESRTILSTSAAWKGSCLSQNRSKAKNSSRTIRSSAMSSKSERPRRDRRSFSRGLIRAS